MNARDIMGLASAWFRMAGIESTNINAFVLWIKELMTSGRMTEEKVREVFRIAMDPPIQDMDLFLVAVESHGIDVSKMRAIMLPPEGCVPLPGMGNAGWQGNSFVSPSRPAVAPPSSRADALRASTMLGGSRGPQIINPVPNDGKPEPKPELKKKSAKKGGLGSKIDAIKAWFRKEEPKSAPAPVAKHIQRPPGYGGQHRPQPAGPNQAQQPVEDGEKSKETPTNKKKKKRGTKFFLTIGLVFLVLPLLAIIGYGFYSANFNYDYSSTERLTEPITIQETTEPWFVTIFNSEEGNEPFLRVPTSITDFLTNFPWRWVLWFLFLWPLWGLLRQDRFAAQERTDVRTASFGVVALLIGVVCSGILATLISSAFPVWGPAIGLSVEGITLEMMPVVIQIIKVIVQILIVIVGIGMNFAFQWAASMSGRRDYTALAIAFCFFTGVVLIGCFVPSTIPVIVGAGLMGGGVLLQAKEMNRTHQNVAAFITTLVMLGTFGISMIVWYGLAGLATNAPVPSGDSVQAMAVLYYLAYKSRLFVGAIVGLGLANAAGNWFANEYMPPENADNTVFKGNPVPDHRNGHSGGQQDDFESKWTVDAKFDAMAFGIMMLYVLAPVVYYVLQAFLLV